MYANTTIDTIIYPDLKICQPAEGGFRFGCDSVVLASFVKVKKNWRMCDAGSGSGIIAALIAKKYGVKSDAIEIQDDMFYCLTETIKLSGLNEFITPIHEDINNYRSNKKYDAVVCNPPYRKEGIGRVSKDELERNARFCYYMNLRSLINFCRVNLKHGGRLFFCYDADRLVEALYLCREGRLEPKRMRLLYPRIDKPAKLLLLECIFGGGEELIIEPPLFQTGVFSEEYKGIYSE